jgi:hypothetical protein
MLIIGIGEQNQVKDQGIRRYSIISCKVYAPQELLRLSVIQSLVSRLVCVRRRRYCEARVS